MSLVKFLRSGNVGFFLLNSKFMSWRDDLDINGIC